MGKKIKEISTRYAAKFSVVDGDIDGPNPPMGDAPKRITHKIAGYAGVTRRECYVIESHSGGNVIIKEEDVWSVRTEDVEDDKVPTS